MMNMMLFSRNKKQSTYQILRDQWAQKHARLQHEVIHKHSDLFAEFSDRSKQLAIGSIGSMVLFATPLASNGAVAHSTNEVVFDDIDKSVFLMTDLSSYLPANPKQGLIPGQEKIIEAILSRDFGLDIRSEIDGKRLERNYGIIGAEQHLMRYPGDTMESHFDNQQDAEKYYSSGMAPGRGGFGYFAYSKDAMTQKEIDREKYYIAVQTFRAPDYLNNVREYVDFFKFRKMLVVNPHNGKAVVVVIGDAGPGVSTGKHLGGSPEVMKYLERVDGKARGPVLFFFINDPDDSIPLGPIEPGGVGALDLDESLGNAF